MTKKSQKHKANNLSLLTKNINQFIFPPTYIHPHIYTFIFIFLSLLYNTHIHIHKQKKKPPFPLLIFKL